MLVRMAGTAAAAFLFFPKSTPKPYVTAVKSRISLSPPPHLSVYPLPCPAPAAAAAVFWTQKGSLFRPCSDVQEFAMVEETEGAEEAIVVEADNKSELYKMPDLLVEIGNKRKLIVTNLPRSCSVPDIEQLFSQCGTVKEVELIKPSDGTSTSYAFISMDSTEEPSDGTSTSYAFISMDSTEEAVAVIEKFDGYELLGRNIRVESGSNYKKPSRPSPGEIVIEPRHKIYVSNLAWKVGSVNLKEPCYDEFRPVSARLVFDSLSDKSAGYGFVSFATKEEAEAVISELDGKVVVDMRVELLDEVCAEILRKQLAKMEEGVPSFSIDTETDAVYVLDYSFPIGGLDSISTVKKAEFRSC